MGRREHAFTAVPVVFGCTALTLSFLANIGCQAIQFKSDTSGFPSLSFGIWYYHSWQYLGTSNGQIIVRDTCVKYGGGVDMDAKWKTAMAFSIISLVFGFFSILASCKGGAKAGGLFFLTTLCQGLTMLLLSSNACNENPLLSGSSNTASYTSDCELDWGMKCNISAVVFWFVAGLSMARAGKAGAKSDRESREVKDEEEP